MTDALLSLASDWGQFILGGVGVSALGIWGTIARRITAVGETAKVIKTEMATAIGALDDRVHALESAVPRPFNCQIHTSRLASIEQSLALGVTHEDMKRAHVRIDALSSEFGEIKGLLEGIRGIVSLLHEHALRTRRDA